MRISVVLEALTGSFDADLERSTKAAQRRFDELERQANAAMKEVAGALVLGGTAFAAFTKTQIDAADKLSKLSQSTGIAVDTLSGLELAAKLGNVEIDQLGQALAHLSKNAVEAAAGGKAQMEAFAALGVSVKNADGSMRSVDDLLNAVADSFAGVKDGVAKAALAQDLFGRSGADLIPFLNQGSKGLSEMRGEAEQLGLVLDKTTAAAAEQFNDNLTRLEAAAQGVSRGIITDLIKPLNDYTDSIVDAAKHTSGFKEAGEQVALGMAITAESLIAVVRLLGAVESSFEVVFEDLKTIGVFLERGGPLGLALESNRKAMSDQLDERNGVLADANDKWSHLWNDNLTILSDSMRQAINEAKVGGVTLDQTLESAFGKDAPLMLKPEFRGPQPDQAIPFAPGLGPDTQRDLVIASHDDATKAIDKHAEALQKLQDELNGVGDEEGKDAVRRGLLNELYASGAISVERYNDELAAMGGAYDTVIDKTEKTADLMKGIWEEAGRSIQHSLADFLFDPFKHGLDGMLEDFAKTLQRMVAEQAAAGFLSSIGNWGKANAGDGGFLGSLATGVSSLFGGGEAPHRAGGGPITGGEPYWVGENGPELVIPNTSGFVIPNNRAMAGAGTVVNMTVNTPDADSFRRSDRQLARRLRGRLGQ